MGDIADILTRKRLGIGSKTDRLEAIETTLRHIRKLLERKRGLNVDDVAAKFAMTGENALPMRTAEVAIVLGVTKGTVLQLVHRKKLTQRWPGGRFHPDDIRQYIGKRAS